MAEVTVNGEVTASGRQAILDTGTSLMIAPEAECVRAMNASMKTDDYTLVRQHSTAKSSAQDRELAVRFDAQALTDGRTCRRIGSGAGCFRFPVQRMPSLL
jgi:hypothetical protein